MAAADTARLVASLELQDKFTKGVDRALGGVDKLEDRFARIGRIAQGGIASLSRNLTLIGVAAGGVVTTQVVAGIKALEELERVSNATEGVIKSTGGAAGVTAQQIRDMAQALEEVTTADDKVIQGGQNLLLTFTNIGEDVFPQATKAMVDLGIAMAQGDVANADFKASAIQIGKALNDPIRGITALRRVGVSFTKEQEAQIRVLVESGRVMEAQKLILGELEREFGEAGAAAGKGFGADLRRFQDAVEEAQMALARGFLPVITRVATFLNQKLAEPATLKAIEEFGVGLADAFEQVLAAGSKIPWDSIGSAMQLAGMGAKAALDFFTGLPPWVQTAVITGWGLNKLTGGALGSIVGELGSGLIKGVLGMNAGVVNINAAVVNGAGGVPGAAGATGAGGAAGTVAGAASKVIPLAITAGLVLQVADIFDEALRSATNDPGGGGGIKVDFGPLQNIIGKSDAATARGASAIEEAQRWGTGRLNDSLKIGFGGLSQDARAELRAQAATGLAVQRAGERTAGQVSQLAAATARYAGGQAAAAERIKAGLAATAAAARAAGQQAAFAIRDKDLSFTSRTTVNVSTSVSVAETIKSRVTFKKIGNFVS